jgi:hypothetical protein
MTGFTGTRTTKVRCRAMAAVSAADVLRRSAIAGDLILEAGRLGCELGADHGGSHVALAGTARDGDQWWWLRWDGHCELIQIDPCDVELRQGRDTDDCFLPDGHPGPHSFDMPPLPRPPGAWHPVRPRPRTP